jgi:hypothetical protein
MIYTIGYSNRSLPEFLRELEKRGITQLVDVRSSPWSRNAAFNAPQIEAWASKAGIFYRQSGHVLGGRTTFQLDAPEYLAELDCITAASCREPLAIMCAEGDPAQCHRTWDVGASLLVRDGIIAKSILRDGKVEDITTTLARIHPSSFKPVILERFPQLLNREGFQRL